MNDFYEPLGVHGRWVVVGNHGRCWVPAHVEVGWRPYSNGHWQRTDAGWYWMSDEPWGWATYHYGRWDWRSDFGWYWVPRTQWAPAWVCWREGGGYVGWAPLRPSVTFGVNIGWNDYEPAHASRAFVFVEHRRMLEPVRPRTVVVNNTTIINQTVNITRVHEVNKTVIVEGPRPEVIERESGRKVQAIPARDFRHREETAVAARERHIPTTARRVEQAPTRHEPERVVAPVPAPAPREVRTPERTPAIAKPAEAAPQPTRPTAAARPTPALPAVTRPQPAPAQPPVNPPVREERKPELAVSRPATTPAAAPASQPEVRLNHAGRFAPVPRESRPAAPIPAIAKPAPVVNAAPEPARITAPRDEARPKPAVERAAAAAPRVVTPKPRSEIRPEVRKEAQPPVKAEAAPARPTDPTSIHQPQKPVMSPKETARTAGRVEAHKKVKETSDVNEADGRGNETRTARPTPGSFVLSS